MKTSPHHIHRRRVEFSETDMAGIVHFANFYRWMEAAEVEWFEKNGLNLIDSSSGSVIGWPRVRSRCDFHAPAYFREEIEVHLWIKEVKIRAIEFSFRFLRADGDQSTLLAKGSMATVCAVRSPLTGEMESQSIPANVNAALEAALAQ